MIIKITGNKHQNAFFQSFSLVSHHKIIPNRDKYGSCVFLAMGFPHRICGDPCGWPHLVSTNRKWIIEWKKRDPLHRTAICGKQFQQFFRGHHKSLALVLAFLLRQVMKSWLTIWNTEVKKCWSLWGVWFEKHTLESSHCQVEKVWPETWLGSNLSYFVFPSILFRSQVKHN